MSFWTAIVVIVLIVSITQVMKSKHNARAGYATDDAGNPVGNPQRELEVRRVPREIEGGAGEGAARIEIADLKERIRKLEAIASGVDL